MGRDVVNAMVEYMAANIDDRQDSNYEGIAVTDLLVLPGLRSRTPGPGCSPASTRTAATTP